MISTFIDEPPLLPGVRSAKSSTINPCIQCEGLWLQKDAMVAAIVQASLVLGPSHAPMQTWSRVSSVHHTALCLQFVSADTQTSNADNSCFLVITTCP
jgi:hypothetical protein